MQKTKMIFTIGPASESQEVLSKLIEAGMSVARLNFSHSTHEEHKLKIDLIKKLRQKHNRHVAIMIDIKGPKIRTHNFKADKVKLLKGSKFTIICGEEILGDETHCSISYSGLYKDVAVGNKILVDDGLLELTVESIDGNKIHCIADNTSFIGNHKGVNVPSASINVPAVTDKDKEDLIFGCQMEVDMVAASYIRKASDVLSVRKILDENGGEDIQVFSKIESCEGIKNIDKIIEASDGIMIARGDMGVEIPLEQVPLVQKMIIEKCNKAGKPVITATQMLDSMIRNPRPTRAEVSDIVNAIFNGTDAIMLSGESANGNYPIAAAQTMAKTAQAAEDKIDYVSWLNKNKKSCTADVSDAISLSACIIAAELNASAIITASAENAASMLSKYRPKCPIISVISNEKAARKAALCWGVAALISKPFSSTEELITNCQKELLETGYVKKGDLIVVVAGVYLFAIFVE
ncbi:pyruvate kinase [Clostridium sp. 19966]|uniref:pyruvate kinase n=1 Tax=Clostridium sp. 19966 TaxID=2768166 RepID=UPI0028DFBDA9|nr:pyruvate kinase [Clostridium sp. 19966]MDT8717332.1 pyruvate kinase [Clostridium sp. 19966]